MPRPTLGSACLYAISYHVEGATGRQSPRENHSRAEQVAQQAVELNPHLADGYLARGFAYQLVRGRNVEAIESYRQALKLAPNLEWAWFSLGYCYQIVWPTRTGLAELASQH